MGDYVIDILREHLNVAREEPINLATLFRGRNFVMPNIPMDPRQFDARRLMERSILNIMKQHLHFGGNVWRQFIRFYDRFGNQDFARTRSNQIKMETIYLYTKCDADQLAMQCNLCPTDPTFLQRRSSIFEDDFLNFLIKCLGDTFNISLAAVDDSIWIKQRLKCPAIRESIRQALIAVNVHPLALLRFDVDANYESLVDDMVIYQTIIWDSFDAATLTDGFILNQLSTPSKGLFPNSFEAYLVTTAAHEFGHFAARKLTNDYAFSTPTSNLRPTQQPRKDVVDKRVYLELGRYVEYCLFGPSRPDWRLTNDATAAAFLHKLATKNELPILIMNETVVTFPPFISQATINSSSAPV